MEWACEWGECQEGKNLAKALVDSRGFASQLYGIAAAPCICSNTKLECLEHLMHGFLLHLQQRLQILCFVSLLPVRKPMVPHPGFSDRQYSPFD